jgi:hypothetical protein
MPSTAPGDTVCLPEVMDRTVSYVHTLVSKEQINECHVQKSMGQLAGLPVQQPQGLSSQPRRPRDAGEPVRLRMTGTARNPAFLARGDPWPGIVPRHHLRLTATSYGSAHPRSKSRP